MKQRIQDAIKQLQEALLECEEATSPEFARSYNALELPDLVCSIVDYLQPMLLPYEAALYWHMFKNSVVLHGQQGVRVSVRGMQEGIIASTRADALSYGTVQDALRGLENKNAIVKMGDTNREGTPYRVCLPDEIEGCKALMVLKSQNQNAPASIDEKTAYDFYNVKENRLKVFERDGYKCTYCGKSLTRFSATLDHIQPVSQGGDHQFGNLKTACLHCNSTRGNSAVRCHQRIKAKSYGRQSVRSGPLDPCARQPVFPAGEGTVGVEAGQ